jgi:hypothetical protein
MKGRAVLSICLAVALFFAVVMAGEGDSEAPWFDPEKCVFCKELTAEPGLLEHFTAEYHNISNGIVCITAVDSEYKDAYLRAQKAMEKVAADMAGSSKVPYMCGHCTTYGSFMMAGVKPEHVQSDIAEVLIMTSSDSTMVTRLQAFGDRSNKEWVKLMDEPESADE